MKTVEVLMVDDHTLFREGLKNLLEVEGEVRVVAQAGTAQEGLEKACMINCDLALVDVSLPDKDGIWLVRNLRERRPDLPVLMISMHFEDRIVLEALEAGARGYITKTANRQELVAAISEIYQGRSYIHSRVAMPVLHQLRNRRNPSPQDLPGGALTPREKEILTLAAQGHNSQGIADQLCLSVSTVKTHLRGLYRKLDVSDRTQAVLQAIQRKIIEQPNLQIH